MKNAKRFTAIILSALMAASVFSAVTVSAKTLDGEVTAVSEDLKNDDYMYIILDDGTVEIKTYMGDASEVIIPNTIDGKKVTSIGDEAFYENKNLEKITIPDSVTNIGNAAFSGTAWYENQPDGMVFLGKVLYAYKGIMYGNTNIVIPDGTVSISKNAFCGYLGLTKVTIPSSLKKIGEYAFGSCSSLRDITFSNGLTDIGDKAFYDCYGLTDITLPESVTSIGNNAFEGCSRLKNIVIPDNVIIIGDAAFCNCENLSEITIPNNITNIGKEAFLGTAWYNNQSDGMVLAGKVLYGYKGVMPENTSIEIPFGTISIGNSAFYDCSNLTNVTILTV